MTSLPDGRERLFLQPTTLLFPQIFEITKTSPQLFLPLYLRQTCKLLILEESRTNSCPAILPIQVATGWVSPSHPPPRNEWQEEASAQNEGGRRRRLYFWKHAHASVGGRHLVPCQFRKEGLREGGDAGICGQSRGGIFRWSFNQK